MSVPTRDNSNVVFILLDFSVTYYVSGLGQGEGKGEGKDKGKGKGEGQGQVEGWGQRYGLGPPRDNNNVVFILN